MKTKAIFVLGLGAVLVSMPFSRAQDPNRRGLGALKPGTRGMAINLPASGNQPLVPGAMVDVVHTFANEKKRISRIIVENVRVLAMDQQRVRPEDRPNQVPLTVTLELTAKQALILSKVLHEEGALTLLVQTKEKAGQEGGDLPRPKKEQPARQTK